MFFYNHLVNFAIGHWFTLVYIHVHYDLLVNEQDIPLEVPRQMNKTWCTPLLIVQNNRLFTAQRIALLCNH